MQGAKTIITSLVLAGLAIGFGYYLGDVIQSPNWQSAVRLVVVGGLITVSLSSPANGLMLWIVLAPFALASYTTMWYTLNIRLAAGVPDLTLERLMIGVLTTIWLAELASGRRHLRSIGATESFMAAFLVLIIPAVLAGTRGINRTGQIWFDKFATPYLVYLLAKNLYHWRSGLSKLLVTLGIIGAYLCFMILVEHVTGQPMFAPIGRTLQYSRSLRKIVSLLGNPSFLGTVLGMIVPIALYRFVRDRTLYGRTFFGALFAAAMLGNFFCYNRGAWLALAASVVVLILLERDYRRLLLPVLLVGGVIALLYWQMLTESAVVTERLSNVNSVRFRVDMLDVSARMFRANWLTGVGVDSFGYYFTQYGGRWETMAYDIPTPHNTYVLVLTTMGILGFVPYTLVFLSMLIGFWQACRRARDWGVDRALMVSGIAVVVVYTVSAAAVDLYINVFTSFVFFLITGTLAGYIHCQRRAAGVRG